MTCYKYTTLGSLTYKTDRLNIKASYESNIEMGRYDANYGNVLKIGSSGKMDAYPLGNLRLRGQVRRIEAIKTGGKTVYVFARNDDKALLISPE